MIEGYLPGLVRVDPVGVAPAEVVRLAARCELLEAVADAAAQFMRVYDSETSSNSQWSYHSQLLRLALVAAGATGKAGT